MVTIRETTTNGMRGRIAGGAAARIGFCSCSGSTEGSRMTSPSAPGGTTAAAAVMEVVAAAAVEEVLAA